MENQSAATKSVGELLDDLFKTNRHPSGREYTHQEVSKGVNGELDVTYIAKLRKGKIPNPGRNALMLLCRFFQIQPSYFFPELAPQMADSHQDDALDLHLRSANITPEVKAKILDLVRALEGEEPRR